MGFAVELYFDEQAAKSVRTIWESIETAGLSGFIPTSGSRPHVSLAVYSHLVPSEIEPLLSTFSREVGEMKIEFDGVSTFPGGGGVVFLAPKPTTSLRDLHSRFHALASDFAGELSEYYAPGAWVPHCTLDMDLSEEEVLKVIELCTNLDLPTDAQFVELGLIEFRPIRQLMSFPLRPVSQSL